MTNYVNLGDLASACVIAEDTDGYKIDTCSPYYGTIINGNSISNTTTLNKISKENMPDGVLYFDRDTNKLYTWHNGTRKNVGDIPEVTLPSSWNNATSIVPNTSKEKENNIMNIPSMKFDFGPMSSNDTQMSPYGLAIKYKDAWYAYNAATSQTVDVTGMTFDFEGMIYKTPVAISAVQEGDLIIHQGRPVYVIQVNSMNSIEVVDLAASEQKTVIPVSNMFGFNFITKVAPLFNFGAIAPSADNPFGNIVPMLLMSSLFGDKNDSNKSKENDIFKMMAMMSMMGKNNPFGQMFNFGVPAAASPKAK